MKIFSECYPISPILKKWQHYFYHSLLFYWWITIIIVANAESAPILFQAHLFKSHDNPIESISSLIIPTLPIKKLRTRKMGKVTYHTTVCCSTYFKELKMHLIYKPYKHLFFYTTLHYFDICFINQNLHFWHISYYSGFYIL